MSTTSTIQTLETSDVQDKILRFRKVQEGIVNQIHNVIVGQHEIIEQVLIGLFVGGHCLITGLPGTAKTLLVRTIGQILGLEFKRIQFTPDLMPSDITGTDIIEEDPTSGRRTWTFVPGPIFANILLADEINRTPPKTQSALLEAMQELSCTVRGNQYKIRPPYLDIRPRPHFLEHPAGRRNQPYASQDAIGAARGHAGAFLYRPRQSL